MHPMRPTHTSDHTQLQLTLPRTPLGPLLAPLPPKWTVVVIGPGLSTRAHGQWPPMGSRADRPLPTSPAHALVPSSSLIRSTRLEGPPPLVRVAAAARSTRPKCQTGCLQASSGRQGQGPPGYEENRRIYFFHHTLSSYIRPAPILLPLLPRPHPRITNHAPITTLSLNPHIYATRLLGPPGLVPTCPFSFPPCESVSSRGRLLTVPIPCAESLLHPTCPSIRSEISHKLSRIAPGSFCQSISRRVLFDSRAVVLAQHPVKEEPASFNGMIFPCEKGDLAWGFSRFLTPLHLVVVTGDSVLDRPPRHRLPRLFSWEGGRLLAAAVVRVLLKSLGPPPTATTIHARVRTLLLSSLYHTFAHTHTTVSCPPPSVLPRPSPPSHLPW